MPQRGDVMSKASGKVTVNFNFSHHGDGELIGKWLRDIARDGTIGVYIVALWETGNAEGYYAGKRERATTAATRKLYDERRKASVKESESATE